MSFPATDMVVGGPFTKEVRLTSIRKLAARVKPETITDDQITVIAIRKDSKVFNLTAKYDWSETDAEFPLFIDASNCYTAMELLHGFADSQSLQEEASLELKVNGLIQEINGKSLIQESSTTLTTDGIGGEQKGTFN